MIVRNEEANLPECLAGCAGLFDELVIVETGSTDRTREIAAQAQDKHGRPARVFDFEWRDDFSAARNESLQRATGDWVFWMDADERLHPGDRAELQAFLSSLDRSALPTQYAFDVASFGTSATNRPVPPYVCRRIRLVPRVGARWKNRLHEEIEGRDDMLQSCGPVTILHYGHVDHSSLAAKRARNVVIARCWAQQEPDNPDAVRALATSLRCVNEIGEALRIYDSLLNMPAVRADRETFARFLGEVGRISADGRDWNRFDLAIRALQSMGSGRGLQIAVQLQAIDPRTPAMRGSIIC